MSCGQRPRLRHDLGHVPLWWFCSGPAFKLKDNFRIPEIPANSHPELQKSQNILNSTSQSDPKVCLRALNKPLANHLKIENKGTQKSAKRYLKPSKMEPRRVSKHPILHRSPLFDLFGRFWVPKGYPLGVTFGTVFITFGVPFSMQFLVP